jgi:hypothetical protein
MPKNLITTVIVLLAIGIEALTASTPLILTPKEHEPYEIKEGKIYYRHGNAGLILEQADDSRIAAYFKERGAELGNPFGRPGAELRESTFFLLTLINRTNGNLTFTPRYVTLKIKTEANFPLDFTVLLGMLEDFDAHQKKIVTDSIFHSPETIRPGEIISKFLIFPPLPKKFKEIKLEFDYLYFEDKEIRLNFYFLNNQKS